METEKKENVELQLIQQKEAAKFNLTPVGQMVKQFEVTQRMAAMYNKSSLVPERYQKNVGDCVIAIEMAMRMNANPIAIMQNLYVVHGNPAFSSQFLIATVNNCGRFKPLRYEFRGKENTDDRACRAYSYEIGDSEKSERLEGSWITIGIAKREGWYQKSGSKWQSMPEQMLRYRAAAFWQRVYAPEISMGFLTKEEVEDVEFTEVKPHINVGFQDSGVVSVQETSDNEQPEVKKAEEQPIVNPTKDNDRPSSKVEEKKEETKKPASPEELFK
jgi:hypothetical protein